MSVPFQIPAVGVTDAWMRAAWFAVGRPIDDGDWQLLSERNCVLCSAHQHERALFATGALGTYVQMIPHQHYRL
jgi:hypothetical protein